MKFCRTIAALFVVSLFYAPWVVAQDALPRAAVFPFNAIRISEADAETLTGLFETALVKTGAFDVIEKNNINAVLETQEYSLSEAVDEAYAVRIGRLLSAEQILLGTCSSLDGKYVLNVRIVDVSTGKNLKADKVDAETLTGLADAAETLAGILAGARTPSGTSPDHASASGKESNRQYSELFIETEPAGADIFINGKKVGVSPDLLSRIPVGTVRVEARKGILYAAQDVVTAGSTLRVRMLLKEIRGTLFIRAADPSLRVVLDGKDIGRLGNGFFERQPVGTHTLELRGKGMYWKGTVQISENESTRVDAVLKEFGDLQYRLPRDVFAEISGPNFIQTVSGSGSIPYLDIGMYSAVFRGETYVETSQTFEIRRGVRVDLSPKLVRTREYEENVLEAALAEAETLLQNGRLIEKVPELLEKITREIGNSRYVFDGIDEKLAKIKVAIEERTHDANIRKFSEEIDKYRAIVISKKTTDRDVMNFERSISEAKKRLHGIPDLMVRAEVVLADMRLQTLISYRDLLVVKQARAVIDRKNQIKSGWTWLGAGLVFGGLAGLSFYLEGELRESAFSSTLRYTTLGCFAGCGISLGVASLLWITAPDPAQYNSPIAKADADIERGGR